MLARMRAVWGAMVVAFIVAIPLAPAAADARVTMDRSLAASVEQQINVVREENGLAPLRVSLRLAAAAAYHTREMATSGYFGHESANGSAFSARIARFYPSRGFARWDVGENLIWGSPGLSADDVVRSWLASAEHRTILLSASWRELGLGVADIPAAPGTYGDRQTTIVTADFGARTH
jgi:uncharacterized protein YkwD